MNKFPQSLDWVRFSAQPAEVLRKNRGFSHQKARANQGLSDL